jgi:hypothetical protein
MVGCDGRNWHQYIADYCLHADKELVEKISQDAKERQSPGTNQYTKRSGSVPTGTTSEPGESSKKLAEIAGTGPASPHGVSRGSLNLKLSQG